MNGARICVVVGRSRHKMMLAEMLEAHRLGAKLLELRLDFLARPPDLKRLLANKRCDLVATVRRAQDGGRWGGREEQRQLLLRQAIVSGGFEYVDIETDVIDNVRRFKDVKRIVSYHNLDQFPADIDEIFDRMSSQDADIVKIAVPVNHPCDNLKLLGLVKDAPKPTIAIGLGELGLVSRILGAKFGSPFTYASFNPERTMAPGLPTFETLAHVYPYESIGKNTRVFSVVGDPVGHSLGPQIHNAMYRKLKVDAVYVALRAKPEEFAETIRDYALVVPVDGFSVTIPHKVEAVQYGHVQDDSVRRSGAANTLVREGDKFHSYNTDYFAARDSLLANLPVGQPNSPGLRPTLRSLVLGAGGVARAVADMLVREGTTVTIANRTNERAQHLAEELGCLYVPWEERHAVDCDLLVNATSCGMYPKMDESPFEEEHLRADLLIFEMIYTPENTLLVKQAKARGCNVLTGVDMFVRQAAEQFKLFTGVEGKLEQFTAEIRKAMSPLRDRPTQEE